jgi:hypothetical protein
MVRWKMDVILVIKMYQLDVNKIKGVSDEISQIYMLYKTCYILVFYYV